MNLHSTIHGSVRTKQRAFSNLIQDLFLEYGHYDRRGTVNSVYLNKKSFQEIKKYGGSSLVSMANRYKDAYLIVSEDTGQIITAAFSTKNSNFKKKR